MRLRQVNRTLPAAIAAACAAAVLIPACSSSAPSPSWCAPLVTQFHAKETRQAYIDALKSLRKQGAPVGQLIADETAYTQNQADAGTPGTAGFGAVASAPALLGKVSSDLKALNAACGQPGDAYKGDNA